MRVIRQIRSLRRLSKLAAEERARHAPIVTMETGSLVEFIPRVSPNLLAPYHLRDLTDSFERGARELGSVTDAHSMPVRTGKTTTVEHFIPWLLLKYPWRRILYLTYQHDVAEERTIAAQRIYLTAGGQLGTFQRGGFWSTPDDAGFCLGAGVGGPLTGRGFTDIICDDLHKNRKEAESRIIREGVIRTLYSDVYTRRDRRGTNIWIIGARWHPNDVVGAVSRHPDEPFTLYNLPAMADDGTSNVPDFYSTSLLQKIRRSVGEYVFGGLYQGNPKLPGGKLFGAPWQGRIDPPSRYKIAIGIDLVRGKKTRTDHNAAAALRLNGDNGRIDVLGAIRAKGTIMDRSNADGSHVDEGFVRLFVAFLSRFPGAAIVMRASDRERALVELFRRMLSSMLGREIEIHVLEAKLEKWVTWQPYAEAWNDHESKRICFADVNDSPEAASDTAWQGPYIDEHMNGEGIDGETNDWIDCGSAAFDFLTGVDQSTSLVDAMMALGRIR